MLKEEITIADGNQPDFPIIYANEGFARMTGYSESETLGRNCRFSQSPNREPRYLAALRQAVSQRKSCAVELTNYRKNGEMFINYLSLTPIFDNDGKLQHYVGIQSDITGLSRGRRRRSRPRTRRTRPCPQRGQEPVPGEDEPRDPNATAG